MFVMKMHDGAALIADYAFAKPPYKIDDFKFLSYSLIYWKCTTKFFYLPSDPPFQGDIVITC